MTDHWSRKIAVILTLGLLWSWFSPVSTSLAASPDEVILEIPIAQPAEKQAGAPNTSGPLISDNSLPITIHHASAQLFWTWAIARAVFTPNWRQVSPPGNFNTLTMATKFSYGLAKDLEIDIAVPYILDFANNVNLPQISSEHAAKYGGIGDISLESKYLLLGETASRPAVAGVFGLGVPSGHASHLNPGRLGTDAIGTGAFTFTTGVNLYKWLQPFLVYGNLWLNTPVNLYTSGNDAIRSQEFITFNVAVEYPIVKKWVALLEIYSTWTWTSISTPQGFQSPSTVVGALTGIEYLATDHWSIAMGETIDLIGKAGGAKVTPMSTVYYRF